MTITINKNWIEKAITILLIAALGAGTIMYMFSGKVIDALESKYDALNLKYHELVEEYNGVFDERRDLLIEKCDRIGEKAAYAEMLSNCHCEPDEGITITETCYKSVMAYLTGEE